MRIIFLVLLNLGTLGQQSIRNVECPILGIDLGTTKSCVGIFKNGVVEIIPNELGNKITPSIVAFTDTEILVGEAAKDQSQFNPLRTFYDVKRLIGRKYSDPIVQYDKTQLLFEVIENRNKIYLQVSNFKVLSTKIYTPQEIQALILKKLKEISEVYLGQKVQSVVMAVPSYFRDEQRLATKQSGMIAGLNVIRILNEPTAAIIAYGLDKKKGEINILVFDLGAGSQEVSIATVDDQIIEIIAISEDYQQGGDHYDQRIIDHFLKDIKEKHSKDLSRDKIVIQKLKRAAEQAKRALSFTPFTKIEIKNLVEGFDLNEILTRSKFEELNSDLFIKIIHPIQVAIDDSGLKITDIHEIVMLGGSSRIPRIRQIVKDFLNGKEVKDGINPDEVVCYGAAMQGDKICQESSRLGQGCNHYEFTEISLGIETAEGKFAEIIPRGTIIPTRRSYIYTKIQDSQQTVTISIYEGEKPMAKDNYKLGSFDLIDLPSKSNGVLEIQVIFEINYDNILQVTAIDEESGKTNNIVILDDLNRRLQMQETQNIISDAKTLQEVDEVAKQIDEAKNALDNYIISINNQIKDSYQLSSKLSEQDVQTIKIVLTESQNWLNVNQHLDKEIYELTLQELQKICNPIFNKVFQLRETTKQFNQDDQLSEL